MAIATPARAPLRLIALIVALTVVPILGLFWLGWRLFEQDRQLAARQARDRAEHAADVLIAGLQRSIAASEGRLTAGRDEWPAGAVALTFGRDGVRVSSRERLAFVPVPPRLRDVPQEVFAEGEAREFIHRDPTGAVAVYRSLARSADPVIRAGALMRLARNLAGTDQLEEALNTYARVAEVEGVGEMGFDLAVAAVHARCLLLERHGRTDALRSEADRLRQALSSEKRSISAAQYALFAADVERWLGRLPDAQREKEALADAADRLWHEWRADGPRRTAPERRTMVALEQPVAVLWQPIADGRVRVLLATSAFVASEWVAPTLRTASESHIAVGLSDVQAGAIATVGGTPASAPHPGAAGLTIHRSSASSELPWNVTITDARIPDVDGLERRWRLLAAAFFLLVGLAVTAAGLVVRAVSREIAVARLQSDFVAAVSHEFRTPLTALRQFTDMLRDGTHLDDERRALCYAAQARATDRLTRLVESVLEFGRIEAGAVPAPQDVHDCTELVRAVVEEFEAVRREPHPAIEFAGDVPAAIAADPESLSRAVWNLLDNAVKYSPGAPQVRVEVTHTAGEIRIAVRDRGLGIPPDERSRLFAKFQRGAQARLRGISGTGIGLAMVRQIVSAHRGRVEVDSEPGRGSTFTIVVPAARSTTDASRAGERQPASQNV